MSRIISVGTVGDKIAGLIAGHLTNRLECEGELQWIEVMEDYRRIGIASGIFKLLADWLNQQQCLKICIDVGPKNTKA
jgi:hypothetical protein